MAQGVQTFENHARIIPAFHGGVFFAFVINFLWSAYRLIRVPSADSFVALLVAAALVGLFFYTRIFATTAQDRVIRLEQKLRLERLLPSDLRARIDDFTVKQLIALRFAGDDELPDLCRRVLADKITDQKAIKKSIKRWNPDHLRV
jgi:hypothetical protein